MTITSFPTILQYSTLSSSIADLKSRSQDARTELVTGQHADLKKTLGAGIGDVQIIRKAIDEVAAYSLATNRALGRASVSQYALSSLIGDSANISVAAQNAVGLGDQVSLNLAGTDSENQLEIAIAALNKTFEGRALFSGDAVDQLPLGDAATLIADVQTIYAAATDAADFEANMDIYFDDPTGGFATSFYQGGSGDAPRVEVSEGNVVSYSARADEQEIRDLLRNLSTLAVASGQGQSVDRDTILNTASIGLLEAAEGVASIQFRIGAAEERMQKALTALDAENTTLSLQYNEHVSVDPYDSAVKLQQLEAQLESAFVLTSRISQLSLVNYL